MRSTIFLMMAAALAAACGDDLEDGNTAEGPPTTTATPVPGVYRDAPVVTLTANEDATIYYTVDGSTPTTDSPSGESPVTIDEGLEAGATVRFFAVDTDDLVEDPIKEVTYVVDRLGPAPVEDFTVVVDGRAAAITWNNPAADGFESVVVARITDGAGELPEHGASYDVGDEIGGTRVVFVGTAEEAAEASLPPGGAAYIAWARYDTGTYSEPRAHADLVELPAQTGQLTVDVGDGTVTVDDSRELSFFDVTGDNVVFNAGSVSFDLTIELRDAPLLHNVKLVVSDIGTLLDSEMTNADGTIVGGPNDGQEFRYYGPEAMTDGEAVTRTITVSNALVDSTFTVDFAIVPDEGSLLTDWDTSLESGGWMVDLGGRAPFEALPVAPEFVREGDGPTSSFRSNVIAWDGRFMYGAARNMPRVEKVDLATMSVVGGVDLDVEGGIGGIYSMFTNQARTRLYVVLNEGMHSGGWRADVAAYREDPRYRDLPDEVTAYLVEIDATTFEEVGRLMLDSGPITHRGRRGAISPDDRRAAVITGHPWSRVDTSPDDPLSYLHVIDLARMAPVDDEQPVDLSGEVIPTMCVFTADGGAVVTNSIANIPEGSELEVLGGIVDLDDYSLRTFAPQEGNAGGIVRSMVVLPDGRLLLGGRFLGLAELDPGDAEPVATAFASPYDDTVGAMRITADGEAVLISNGDDLARVALDDGEVVYTFENGVAETRQHEMLPVPF